MTLEQQKLRLLEKVGMIADRIDDRFEEMRAGQLDKLDKALTAIEDLICTRSGSDRRSR